MTEDVPGYRVLEQVGEGGFSVVYRARQEHLDRTVARAWLRQLDPPATREMEDAALRAVARLDGTPFPSTSRLATRWLRGRVPIRRPAGRDPDLETAFCAEIVAVTYQAMGLLPKGRRPNWFDPGRFWSGDDLELEGGAALGGEIAVGLPLT
ncbi:MAG TPA: hypothetical protein VKY91_01285 [Vulgatibacteraceae bacterium]|nr:hypothetical protein [Vulgatibacteraceae bacterium]